MPESIRIKFRNILRLYKEGLISECACYHQICDLLMVNPNSEKSETENDTRPS